jgi:flagellar basal body rod protein FlgB
MYTQVITHTLALADQAMRDDTQDLANSQTPGFRAQTLSFQQQLAQALRQSPAAAATVTGVTETEPGSLSPDGSSVDLTAVMVNLPSPANAGSHGSNDQQSDDLVRTHGLPRGVPANLRLLSKEGFPSDG